MEDMIKRIIELDRMAKENLTRANQLKVDSEQKISDIKEQKRAEYLERARANIKSLEKEEKAEEAESREKGRTKGGAKGRAESERRAESRAETENRAEGRTERRAENRAER